MTVHSISEANKKSDTRAPDVAKAGTEDDIDFVELTQTLEEKLERAETLQTEADSLTDSIADLELQMIEAEMRQNNPVLGLSPDEAGVIGDLLERQALLQAQLGATETQSEERQEDDLLSPRLKEAHEALDLWLNAPSEPESKVAAHGARIFLLIATCGAIYGAIEYHPAVLALLIPIAAPIGLLLSRGEDKTWRRLGAKRRFDNTRVEPPKEWEVADVESRMSALSKQINNLEQAEARRLQAKQKAQDLSDKDYAELTVELVEVEQMLYARCRRANVDPQAIDEEIREQLHLAALDVRANTDLNRQRKERTRLVNEASELSDAVWRTLNQHEATPGGTSTQVDELRSGIEQLKVTHT